VHPLSGTSPVMLLHSPFGCRAALALIHPLPGTSPAMLLYPTFGHTAGLAIIHLLSGTSSVMLLHPPCGCRAALALVQGPYIRGFPLCWSVPVRTHEQVRVEQWVYCKKEKEGDKPCRQQKATLTTPTKELFTSMFAHIR
jgi:hypothetical protein